MSWKHTYSAISKVYICIIFVLCTSLIESSLGSVATKLNFFIHNLAQLKFSGSDERLTLSFVLKIHTMKKDGRICDVFLIRHKKICNPNKGYVSNDFVMSQDVQRCLLLYNLELYTVVCKCICTLCPSCLSHLCWFSFAFFLLP